MGRGILKKVFCIQLCKIDCQARIRCLQMADEGGRISHQIAKETNFSEVYPIIAHKNLNKKVHHRPRKKTVNFQFNLKKLLCFFSEVLSSIHLYTILMCKFFCFCFRMRLRGLARKYRGKFLSKFLKSK